MATAKAKAFAGRRNDSGLRRFDLREELKATAERRKRPQEGGVADIAARLSDMFPSLPQGTVHAAVSELFQQDPGCSREELADRAMDALIQMSLANGSPHAVTSFEPRSFESGNHDQQEQDVTSEENQEQHVDGDLLDASLAELLALPDEALRACTRTLLSILDRIAANPGDERIRHLRHGNARFEVEVGRHEAAMKLLRLAGFRETSSNDDPAIELQGDSIGSSSFACVRKALQGVADDLCVGPPPVVHGTVVASSLVAPPAGQVQLNNSPRDQRRRRIAELTEQRLRDPQAFREAAKARGTGNRIIARPLTAPVTLAAGPSRRAQHFTLADVERMRIEDEIANMPNYAEEYRRNSQSGSVNTYTALVARSYDPELIARQALDGTNRYRASKSLSPLRWHGGIARIAQQHAEQMASGAMPFSHDGFNERVAAFPVVQRAAAENLALNSGVADVAGVAVDGWIKSPGHEKNLRGAFNLCGLGVARASNGTFYLTQLFASAL